MKTLIEFFVMGGAQFMSILLLLLIIILAMSIYGIISGFMKQGNYQVLLKTFSQWVLGLGGFAFVWGFLGQGVGIYMALTAIQEAGDVSPAMIMGGIKVSMIAPFFGVLIFLISILLSLVLKTLHNRNSMALEH